MTTYTLGRISIVWKGTYSAATTYDIQDAVNYNGSSYVCVAASTLNVTPGTDATKWQLAAQGIENVATTAGDIVYYHNGNLVRLPAGNAGQVLMVKNGLPAWEDYATKSSHHVKYGGIPFAQNMSYRKGFAVMTDGSMRVWGDAGTGQLGIGNQLGDRSYPGVVAVPKSHPGWAVHDYTNNYCRFWMTYSDETFAIDNDGQLWSWGEQADGALGAGGTGTNYIPFAASADTANSINGKTVVHIAGSTGQTQNDGHIMVLCSDGSVHSCGYNGHGQLGIGNASTQNRFLEINSTVLSGITQIEGMRLGDGAYHLVKSDGTLWHVGFNGNYQSGNSSTSDNVSPFRIPYFYDNGITVTRVWSGGYTVYALDDANNLYSWGYNSQGQCGIGNYTDQQTPLKCLENVAWCYPSPDDTGYAYALLTDGTVMATGNGEDGALANGTTSDQNTWTPVQSLDNVLNGVTITKIVAHGTDANNSVMMLSSEGKCYSVGYNGNGQLGLGDTSERTRFEEVPIQGNVVDIAGVGYSSETGFMFHLDDGQLYQSGYAGSSQLPEDDDEYSSVPYPIIL